MASEQIEDVMSALSEMGINVVENEEGDEEEQEADPGVEEVDAGDSQTFVVEKKKETVDRTDDPRSEEHTSELQSLMRISYAVFCLKKKRKTIHKKKV